MSVFRLARLVAAALGAGAVGSVAVAALVAGDPISPGTTGLGSTTLDLRQLSTPNPTERQAIELLRRAARAGHERTYSGTQFVTSWSTAGTSSVVADLQHVPGRGILVRPSGAGGPQVVDNSGAATLDPRALAVLGRHYSVSVARQDGHCAGRTARVVEVRPRGGSALAGRFWLDAETGLVLRRELYDESGRTVRAAAFVDLRMAAPHPWTGPTRAAAADPGASLSDGQVAALRRDGWRAPARLANGLELFDARKRDGVLHLSYTDGLFAVSVFSQRGRLNPDSVKGWQRVTMGTIPVWTRPGLSQRVVWSGAGWVHTVVADAPDSIVRTTVAGFPAAAEESFTDRVQRGLHRMGSWVDPTG